MHDPYLRNIQTHHQEVLVEYQRMSQVGTEYQRKHAVLLSDRSVHLFSTDLLPDTGNVVGYHVNVPCKLCLSQPNNGHYWMFRSRDISPQPIYIQLGPENTDLPLLWGFVRDAGDFSGGFYRTGGAEAAHKSCQLSVRFSSTIPLIVQRPRVTRVSALTFEFGDDHYHYLEKCR
ncbi:hypothetical protein K501DRAFT_255391 [Backusella circina FSU 941]|nr:hypothetical protein K501DRAFT_255391 [Backusella circina FSU 941]